MPPHVFSFQPRPFVFARRLNGARASTRVAAQTAPEVDMSFLFGFHNITFCHGIQESIFFHYGFVGELDLASPTFWGCTFHEMLGILYVFFKGSWTNLVWFFQKFGEAFFAQYINMIGPCLP